MLEYLEDDIIYAEPSFSGAFENSELILDWDVKNIGTGMVSIRSKNGQFIINSEYMGKKFVKKLLCRAIDKAIFKDELHEE